LTITLLFFACTNHKPKPQPPNTNWTQLDEPPLFSDCPQVDVNLNRACFAKTLQNKLDVIWASDTLFFGELNDTIYVTLKVDTLGQLSVVNYSHSDQLQIPPAVFTALDKVVASLPLFQPAFKTNLEVPVEIQWTLPVAISN
jgi:hypothetical protein